MRYISQRAQVVRTERWAYLCMEKKRVLRFYRNYYDDFYQAQSLQVQNKIEWTLRLIEMLEIVPEKYLKHITGTDGLYEIRGQSGNISFRIFCFFDTGGTIVLGNGFQKKNVQSKSKKIMNTKLWTTLDEHIEQNYGKRGTKKREEFERGYKIFEQEVFAELEKEQKAKLKKRRLSGATSNRPASRP